MSLFYFSADMHFDDERALRKSHRPFKNTKMMNDTIKDNFSIIRPHDILIVAGDVGNFEHLDFINGKIILVAGNHDTDFMKRNKFSKDDMIDRFNIDTIFTGSVLYNINGEIYNICHNPKNINPEHINLTAHVHDLQKIYRHGINVGVDVWHFRPVQEGTIKTIARDISKYRQYQNFNTGSFL